MFETISIVSIKNRLNTPATGGWSDVLLKFHFADDPNKHICEIQLAHGDMMRVRKRMNAHRAYSEYRCAGELLEATGQQSALEAIKNEAAAVSSAAAARLTSSSPDRFMSLGGSGAHVRVAGGGGGGGDGGGGGVGGGDASVAGTFGEGVGGRLASTNGSTHDLVNVDQLNATIGRLTNENAQLWTAVSQSQADHSVLRDGLDALRSEMAALATANEELRRTMSQTSNGPPHAPTD